MPLSAREYVDRIVKAVLRLAREGRIGAYMVMVNSKLLSARMPERLVHMAYTGVATGAMVVKRHVVAGRLRLLTTVVVDDTVTTPDFVAIEVIASSEDSFAHLFVAYEPTQC